MIVIFIVWIAFILIKQDFCKVNMPSEDNKILEINQYQKSDK